MKELAVAFVWHLHQPYYTDPLTQTSPFPWVRLHATKGYFDMGILLEEHPEMQVTVNLTPSLVLQLQEQEQRTVTDEFLCHASRPAADLTREERAFILRHFFAANWDTMVRPHDRYYGLLIQRGLAPREEELPSLLRRFSQQDLLDLQVWHNLTWCGHRAVARYPVLQELRTKGRQFTEFDKQTVLAVQHEIITQIIPLYRRLEARGQIELSTTPFFHPILPLLIDTEFARRSRPDAVLPGRFAHPEDAEGQIRKALVFHEAVYGRRPTGLWPSEGSVCPELIPILARHGIRWTATDEGILARSVDHWRRNEQLYRSYRIHTEPGDVAVLFRDRELSDVIGFTYARNPAPEGVADFTARLRAIASHSPEARPLVSVILDGENPWENYPDGGEGFLRGVYGAMVQGEDSDVRFQPVIPSREVEEHPPAVQLGRLHTGSWINADLKIWAGHVEDNDAWDRLRETRSFLTREEQAAKAPPEALQKAWDGIYAAEGSDWFWWYGDEFETDHKAVFDGLFRTHLANVYRLLGAGVPEFITAPIWRRRETGMTIRQPTALISPTLDGVVTNFYEWRGAGYIEGRASLSAMHKKAGMFSRIYFGFDLEQFYLRLDPQAPQGGPEASEPGFLSPDGWEIHVEVVEPHPVKLVFPLELSERPQFTILVNSNGTGFAPHRTYETIRRKKIVELAVPLKELGLVPETRASLVIKVVQGDIEVERYPAQESLVLTVPDHTFEARMWQA